jgi:hypothetical protein
VDLFDGSPDPIFEHFVDNVSSLTALIVALVPHCIRVALLTENILIFFKRSTFSLTTEILFWSIIRVKST